MGSAQSNKMKEDIQRISDTIMNVTNSQTADIAQTCTSNQSVRIVQAPDMVLKGNLKANLKADLSCNLTGSSSANFKNNLTNAVSTEIDNMIDQGSQSEQDFASSTVNVQNQSMSVREFVQTTYRSTIENINNFKCSQNLNMQQTAELYLQGTIIGDVIIDEGLQGTAVANCITDTANSTLMQNKDFAKLFNDLDQTLYAKQKGVYSIWSTFMLILALFVIIGGIIVLAGWLFSKSKKKQPTKKKSSSPQLVAVTA